jgi:hypothetical protein
MHPQDVGVRATDIGGVRRQTEDAVGLRVHDGDRAIPGHGQHAVAHAGNHVAEKAVPYRHGRRAAVCRIFVRPASPSLVWHQSVAEPRRVQNMPGPRS